MRERRDERVKGGRREQGRKGAKERRDECVREGKRE